MTPLPPDPDAEPEPDPEPPVGDSAASPESESSTSTSTTTTTAGPRGAPRRNWRVLLLTALAGVCVPLAAPPFDLAPLAFVSPALLWFVLRGRRPRDGLLLGLTAGLCANLVGFRWTVGLLQDFASLPLALCVLLWLLLALAQSLGWAATGFVVAWLEHRRGIAPRWTLPAALVVAEWAVPSVFPWTLALTQHRVLPLVQIAEWTGTAGPALVVAAAGTLLGEAVTVRRLRPALVAVALVGMTALQGSWRGKQPFDALATPRGGPRTYATSRS